MIIVSLVVAICAQVQEPAPQDPPPEPFVEIPGRPPDPRPAIPFIDGLAFRTIALRPRFQLTTREFDVGMLSGKMNFGEVAGFDRTSFAWDARWDSGPWMVTATWLHQESESRLDFDTIFEQHRYPAGSVTRNVAYYGSIEAYYRWDILGGPAESIHVRFLAGVNFSKLRLMMRAGDAEASEGFSALWPLPAIGIEARVWLSERLSLMASARGTRLRYSNPWQLDGGGSQDIRFLSGRFDASFEWALSETLSLSGGFTGIDAFIDAASAEDTDSADLKAGGVHAGVTLKF